MSLKIKNKKLTDLFIKQITLYLNLEYYSDDNKSLKSMSEKLNFVIAQLLYFKHDYQQAIDLLKKIENLGYSFILMGDDYNDETGLGNVFEIKFKTKDFKFDGQNSLYRHSFYFSFDFDYFFNDYFLEDLFQIIMDEKQEILLTY